MDLIRVMRWRKKIPPLLRPQQMNSCKKKLGGAGKFLTMLEEKNGPALPTFNGSKKCD